MRKDSRSEKFFKLTHIGIKIVAVILLVVFLLIYAQKNGGRTFLSFVVPVVFFVVFLLYNFLLTHFHKKGFYTSWQAAEFYAKCCEHNISGFHEETLGKARNIYFSIFGTDKYCGEGTLAAHMEEIYNAGSEKTEKQ